MITIRSRAPLRIGLAGGGTDLAGYSNKHEGAVFNATVSMYAYCTIIPTNDGKIHLTATDCKQEFVLKSMPYLKPTEPLCLHKAVYNRIVKDFNNGKSLSFHICTSADVPAGSGLGTSSTMTVAILEAFDKWLGLGLDNYKKAQLAYQIEREDLGFEGGKQDQYAAVFGGFNMMEFKKDGSVVVNPLRISRSLLNELECSLLLFYSGRSRDSAKIIKQQIQNTQSENKKSLEAMHNLKRNAIAMKDAILTGNTLAFVKLLREGWENKKKTSSMVSNNELERIISFAIEHGAEAVKISGAGGGGFITMVCLPINRQRLFDALKNLHGVVFPVSFTEYGVESWVIK